ncbi:MAG: hypothetical protein GQ581_08705 [Methyloprofundus sp.]|nr:hypothetical protein [Methyloprofundus sp.]
MNESYPLVICDDVIQEYHTNEPVFLVQNSPQLHFNDTSEEALKLLVFAIRKNPKDLMAHMQRIMICYEHKEEAQLYAAVADFFVVLKDAGLAIKQRMIMGVRGKLSADARQSLLDGINDNRLVVGNTYCVLTSGIASYSEMVFTPVESKVDLVHDPLQIARDYIEYSQLEQAQKVLEDAVLSDPERVEIHNDLLELYRLTNNNDGFNEIYTALSDVHHPMKAQWNDLKTYFDKKNEK